MNARRLIPCLFLAVLLTGCTTATKQVAAPSPELNLTAGDSAREATLHHVISTGNSDSWIKNPQWDEYVITLANRSETPLTVEAILLDDLLDQRQAGSDDPKKLFQNTQKNWKAYRKGKVPVTTQAFEPNAAKSALGGALFAAEIAYLWPLDLILVPAAMAEVSKRQAIIKTEFAKRRLVLPLTLAPQSSAKGSIFFPMTASPRRLLVQAQSEGRPLELVMELPPLSGLHLVAATGHRPPASPTSVSATR